MNTIRILNRQSELKKLESPLQAFFKEHGLQTKELPTVQLILEETLSNVIAHGYDDNDDHDILIHLSLAGRDLRIEIEDDGKPFNMLDAPEPKLAATLEEQRIGGFGIHIVRNLADRIDYSRTHGKNHLIVIKSGLDPVAKNVE